MIDRRSLLLTTLAGVGLASIGRSEEPPARPTLTAPPKPPQPPRPMLTPTEFLMHATVRIECTNKQGVSVGTGFFFLLFHQGDNSVPVIVTNKHVVKGATTGSFHLTMAKPDGSPDLTNHFSVKINDFEKGWTGHTDPSVDLCIFPCASIFESLAKEGRKIFWTGLDESIVPTEGAMQDLTPVEDVLIVGYPIGVWDTLNNAPIFRRGITATAPYLDFSGKKEFLIDASIFPGSSGSPVLLFNQGSWIDRKGNTILGGTRALLLGINYAVATYSAIGEIKIEQTPTEMRPVPVLPIPSNLGVCITALRILEFEPLIVQSGFRPPEGYVMRAAKR